MNADTIFAVSSGVGIAGIAIIRLSGPDALTIAQQFGGPLPKSRRLAPRRLVDRMGQVIDHGLVVVFPGPASFTGEDVCEFHLHGSLAVQRALLAALAELEHCRPAEPGEFTRRAFRNGKIDLLEAEGLADLLQARTERQRRQALDILGGKASATVEAWRRDLIAVTAQVTAAIDFSEEEDVAARATHAFRGRVQAIIDAIEGAITMSERADVVRRGVQIVLAGPVNTGKSTLLNALAQREAAIVSAIPGTTRDRIDVHLELGGLPVTITDTAGLRGEMPFCDPIEQEGIIRTYQAMRSADIVILVQGRNDLTQEIPEVDSEVIRLETKCDLAEERVARVDFSISVHTGAGMADFLNGLELRIAKLAGKAESPILIRNRHRATARRCIGALRRTLTTPDHSLELAAECLRQAGDALGTLTGRIGLEDILDRVFGEFCVGK